MRTTCPKVSRFFESDNHPGRRERGKGRHRFNSPSGDVVPSTRRSDTHNVRPYLSLSGTRPSLTNESRGRGNGAPHDWDRCLLPPLVSPPIRLAAMRTGLGRAERGAWDRGRRPLPSDEAGTPSGSSESEHQWVLLDVAPRERRGSLSPVSRNHPSIGMRTERDTLET